MSSPREYSIFASILIAAALVAVTVAVHAVGFAIVLRSLMSTKAMTTVSPGTTIWLLIRAAWWLIFIHALEIMVWALFYLWAGCLPDAESAFYFSGVTYTTLGYGDVVLPVPWRILGPIEGLTGILMCGLSAGLFFAMVTRIQAHRSPALDERP